MNNQFRSFFNPPQLRRDPKWGEGKKKKKKRVGLLIRTVGDGFNLGGRGGGNGGTSPMKTGPHILLISMGG